ncbi:MAG: TetR/AcrR family transcriptional regulator [Bacteroidota bacterium]
MSQTKERIIAAATHLFNEQGFVNVRLQNIADELSISVGNLAYHFKNKEAIIAKAYEKTGNELKIILSTYRASPDLRDLDFQLDAYYEFIKKYPFYFMDILEIKRNHPHLHEDRKELIIKMRVQFEKRIEYNQSRGILNRDMEEAQMIQLADNLCTMVTFWHTSQAIKDECDDLSSFKCCVWIQLVPFLTTKGMEEYEAFIKPGLKVI